MDFSDKPFPTKRECSIQINALSPQPPAFKVPFPHLPTGLFIYFTDFVLILLHHPIHTGQGKGSSIIPILMAKLTTQILQFCCIFILLFPMLLPASSPADLVQTECLSVPSSQFSNSLLSTIDVVRQVMAIFSPFSKLLGDFRLSTAISDCLDLLDSSADQLSWSLSATQNPKGTPLFTLPHPHRILINLHINSLPPKPIHLYIALLNFALLYIVGLVSSRGYCRFCCRWTY